MRFPGVVILDRSRGCQFKNFKASNHTQSAATTIENHIAISRFVLIAAEKARVTMTRPEQIAKIAMAKKYANMEGSGTHPAFAQTPFFLCKGNDKRRTRCTECGRGSIFLFAWQPQR
jgi:hypothetical protein